MTKDELIAQLHSKLNLAQRYEKLLRRFLDIPISGLREMVKRELER